MRAPYEYAVIRVAPRVEREEFVNAGILLFCESRGILRAAIELDEPRLVALFPNVDLSVIREHLAGFACVCRGGRDAGPLGAMPLRERWRWITSPRSTILQTSRAHGGLTDDVDDLVEHLMAVMVRCER